MKLGALSLGCSKNLVDGEVMLGLIEKHNIEIVDNPEEADILLVNTCGFIEAAKEESINAILQMAEYKITGNCKYLIATGCLAQRYADELFKDIPEVDAFIGTDTFHDIVQVIEAVIKGERVVHVEKGQSSTRTNLTPRKLTTPGHMAYLKIAEGCDNCCSYCAIPLIRGPYISKPYELVLEEAKSLAAQGVKEIIVVAQDTTRYGEDLYGKVRLAELLKDLNAIESINWIRVMYCYPNNFNDELIEAFATLDKVCKYIDIPLQHASDNILSSMNRHDKKADVEALLKKLRKCIPEIVIRTTFIVGFPGETANDFTELKDFVQEHRFENTGVFQYSQEENTLAATMTNQIPDEVKEDRFHELMAIQAEISESIRKDQEDKIFEVVIEGFNPDEPNVAIGRSYREAPEIDGDIFIENGEGLKVGDFVQVRISQGFTYELIGEKL